MSTITLTAEQEDVIEKFLAGQHLAIEAGAGTGKTSTLVEIAKRGKGRGQYVAFNRSAADDAGQRMPEGTACATSHALAFRAVGRAYASRLSARRVPGQELAKILRLDPCTLDVGGETRRLSPGWLAGYVLKAIANFARSADEEPSAARHLPYVDGIDLAVNGQRGWTNQRVLREHLAPAVTRAWEDISRPSGTLPFTHDHYLKLWALGRPQLSVDYVLLDEAQDTAPVLAKVIGDQACQQVYVGDSCQEIYSWRGAINAMAGLAGERAWLTGSFRFGPPIAEVANLVLTLLGAEMRLTGRGGDSEIASVPDRHTLLVRTNSLAIGAVITAMLRGQRVHLVGGGGEILSFCRAARDLMAGRPTLHPDLGCFTSWSQVLDYVATDPLGEDLRLMVRLITEYGVEGIERALNAMVSESDADLIVSTAHKAKGREWDAVKLGSDFPDPTDPAARAVGPEELRLLYVAATRARHTLDLEDTFLEKLLDCDTDSVSALAPLPEEHAAESIDSEQSGEQEIAAPEERALELIAPPADDVVEAVVAGDGHQVDLASAKAGDLVAGVFFRSGATGNVSNHFGKVWHVARVDKRYRPSKTRPDGVYVWAHPICGAKHGRVTRTEEAEQLLGVTMPECQRCARKVAS